CRGLRLPRDVGVIVAGALVAGTFALPLARYRTFVIEERFGFNRMTLRLWLLDPAKGGVVGAGLGGPFLTIGRWVLARAGDWWWLYAWAAWVAFQLLVLALYPTLIAPLFNTFQPLADQ